MVSSSVVQKLAELRLQFEQATEPEQWPASAEPQLTLMADVVRVLGGDERQVEEVLGSTAAAFVVAVMDAPV